MKDQVELAMAIAQEAHSGQEYSPGAGYYENHLLPAYEIVRQMGYGAVYQAATLLHDTVEDTDVTLEYLHERGVEARVVRAVDLVSKKARQKRKDYLAGILEDEVAIVVKYADSLANLGNTALLLSDMTTEKFRQRLHRYSENVATLFPHLPPIEIEEERLAS